MKKIKNINIQNLKGSERRLLLEFIKINFLYKRIIDIRLRYLKQVKKTFLNLGMKEDLRVIDFKNEIATLFKWEKSNYDEKGWFTSITPKPFKIDDKNKCIFPQKYSNIQIYKTLNGKLT